MFRGDEKAVNCQPKAFGPTYSKRKRQPAKVASFYYTEFFSAYSAVKRNSVVVLNSFSG